MARAPRARSSDDTHLMPVRRRMTVARWTVDMVRMSEILADDADGRGWCERERGELLRAGIVAEVFAAPGMVALYREARRARLPLHSAKSEKHHAPPETMRIRAEVLCWPNVEEGESREWVWVKSSPWVLARRYRCAFCRRAFVLDEHKQEFIEVDGGRERWKCYGVNLHSRCCRECLPGFQDRLVPAGAEVGDDGEGGDEFRDAALRPALAGVGVW